MTEAFQMGLFTKRRTRSDRKAEAKALKHKAVLEAKLGARNERKRDRAQLRTQRDVAKAQIATLKAEEKAAVKTAERADRELLSAGQIKKYLGVARVLVPVLAPLAYQGATLLRGLIDTRRAQRLGIGIEQLSEFSGPGAKLQARIANAENSLTQIDARGGQQHSDADKFAAAIRERLDNLSTAIRAAEQMPAQRRRAVYTSISSELSGIEADLLSRLGVR